MIKIEKGYDNFPKLVKFMNKVFHHNFTSLLPKLYADDASMKDHFVAKEDGELVGVLGCFPIVYNLKDIKLDIYGIGMVSTDKKHRGKGIMSSLVKASIEEAKQNHIDCMVLTGQRQRYEHFGFVPAGSEYHFSVSEKNLKNADASIYRFVRVKKDSEYLPAMAALYNKQEIRAERDRFYDTLISWYVRGIYAVLRDGVFVGYIVARMWNIHEIVLDNQDIRAVLKAFLRKKRYKRVNIKVNPYHYEAVREYFAFAEKCSVHNNLNLMVVDYERLLNKLFLYKISLDPSYQYRRLLSVQNAGSFDINVGGGIVRIEKTDKTAEIILTQAEAVSKLFTPHGGAFGDLICPICLTHIDNV